MSEHQRIGEKNDENRKMIRCARAYIDYELNNEINSYN